MQCILALDREDFQLNYQIQLYWTNLDLIFISAVRGVTTQIQIGLLRLRSKENPFPCLIFFSSPWVALWFCYVRSGLKSSNRKNYHSSANHALRLYRDDNIPVICLGTCHKPMVLPFYCSCLRDNSGFIKTPKNLHCVSCCKVQNKWGISSVKH